MKYNCPKCSSLFDIENKYCDKCGCNLKIEFISDPICPICNNSFDANTKSCPNDGSILVSKMDMIPKCEICYKPYSDDIKFCPIDGGKIKILNKSEYLNNSTFNKHPKNINGSYIFPKASIGKRFLAALIDGLVTIGLSIPSIVFVVIGISKSTNYDYNNYSSDNSLNALYFYFFAVLFYILPITYNFIKDGLGKGQSIGKKSVNLMVINLDTNTYCGKGKSFLRNFISSIVAFIPFIGWLIEPILVIVSEDGRKLGDKAANTQVIEKNQFN